MTINQQDFDKVVKPVIDWLRKNHNPHTVIIITPTDAELLSGEAALSLDNMAQPYYKENFHSSSF